MTQQSSANPDYAFELSDDVREFLLNYPIIGRAISSARAELAYAYEVIQSEATTRPWFLTRAYETYADWHIFQLWNRSWRSNATPGCPWIHFEYALNWDHLYVEARLDVE